MRKVWVFVPQNPIVNVVAIEAPSFHEAQAALIRHRPTFTHLISYYHPALAFGGDGPEIIVREFHNIGPI